MPDDAELLNQIETLKAFFPELITHFQQLGERLATLESYMNQLRDIIKLPPMFPANPEEGQYFYDEKTGCQYVWYRDEWEDDGSGEWAEID